MARDAITLSFQTIDCDGCGVTRLRAVQCSDCGQEPRPWETQIHLARRRVIVDECLAADVTSATTSMSFAEAVNEVPRILGRINRALQRAAKLRVGSEDVIGAFAELDTQINTWSVRQPRPLTNQARVFARSLDELRSGFGLFLRSLSASDLQSAQQLEREGQALLDAAGETAGQLNSLNDMQKVLNLPLQEYYGYIAGETRIADGLGSKSQELQEWVDFSDPKTADLLGQTIRHLMLSVFDLDRGMKIAEATVRIMADRKQVYQSPAWLREHARCTALLSATGLVLSGLDEDETTFATVKFLLDLVRDSREGLIRHLLATLLAKDAFEYDRLRVRSSGLLIKDCAKAHPDLHLDENLRQELRHAAAHADFDWDGEAVVIRGDGDELHFSESEFLDGCLATLETAAALLLGIHRHAQSYGIRIESELYASKRDREGAIVMALGYMGFEEVSVRLEGETVVVDAAGVQAGFVGIAGCVAGTVSNRYSNLEITIRDAADSAHCFEVALDTVRACRPAEATDERDLILRMAKMMAGARVNGTPVWTEEDWIRAAFGVGVWAENESLSAPIARVRRMMRMAADSDVPAVAPEWNLLLQHLRSLEPSTKPVPVAFRRE